MVNSTGPRRRKSKKGREGPLRTATFADGLAIRGGAPAHDYEHLSNKVAHPRALSSLRCPTLIWGRARAVKQTGLIGDRAAKRKLTRPGHCLAERFRSELSDCTRAGAAEMPFPRQIVIAGDGGARRILLGVISLACIFAVAGAGVTHAISSREVRALVAGEDRRLRGGGATGALDCLSGCRR